MVRTPHKGETAQNDVCKLRRPQKYVGLPMNKGVEVIFIKWEKQNDTLHRLSFELHMLVI